MSTSGRPLLAAERISRSFGAMAGLRDASISIKEGQILGLVGDDGAGKSTLINLMMLGKRDLDIFLFIQKYVLMKRGALGTIRLGRPHRDLDPHVAGEVDELLDALALLELFGRCRDAGR
jgi:ABC-type glutathione transport system ATPase component